MIGRLELLDQAKGLGLSPQVVEKDYVLGWLLAGIHAHPELGQTWVFKGGTCLKKCYFETYRFSEDLDFTVGDPAHLERPFLEGAFNEIAAWLEQRTGIVLPVDCRGFEPYETPRKGKSCEGRICYKGPIAPGGYLPKIKLDLTNDEHLALEPVVRMVHHAYSDREEALMKVRCYAFEEVFAEKVRALAERLRPRDLYDVVHLFRRSDFGPDRRVMLEVLRAKCAFKAIELPTAHFIEDHPGRTELGVDWEQMLKHQLPALPPFQDFWETLPLMFQWLYGEADRLMTRPIPPDRPTDQVEEPIGLAHDHPDDTHWPGQPYFNTRMHRIRFAAANRLCIELAYGGKKRLIEPYALRQTVDDNMILMAVKHDTGEPRSYRLDRIEGALISNVPFTPQYTVELGGSGSFRIQPTVLRGASSYSGFLGGSTRTGAPKGRAKRRHIYRCPSCNREFPHSTRNRKLNPHKDRHGQPCRGRMGIFERTEN
ncbi:MAG TPA: nucleotidyl transferase AbiEii/AbiGii toxin family protein [Flavobacteriales bacterium]|nr:nucleotidyl transferase AbiEii/AbiGii toxin family protein [Flavobacteriales bacterium]